jgi:hypothetical protein
MKDRDIPIRPTFVVPAVMICLLGCWDTHHELMNQGRLCVFPASSPGMAGPSSDATPRSYVANEALDLTVAFPQCLSSTCTSNRKASCTVERDASSFVVRAVASYDQGSGSCSDDCLTLTAHCATPHLAEGTFSFQYRGETANLAIPSSVVPPCVGSSP